jgi:hypothetical protein
LMRTDEMIGVVVPRKARSGWYNIIQMRFFRIFHWFSIFSFTLFNFVFCSQ